MKIRYFAHLKSGKIIECEWNELKTFWKDKTSLGRINHWQFPIETVVCVEE